MTETVMSTMNKINTEKRDQEAVLDRTETDKILVVKGDEAKAETRHLSGIGTAKMRRAITNGFCSSIESMKESCSLESPDVVHMMMITYYLDVLRVKEFAQLGRATMVVLYGQSAVADIES